MLDSDHEWLVIYSGGYLVCRADTIDWEYSREETSAADNLLVLRFDDGLTLCIRDGLEQICNMCADKLRGQAAAVTL